MQIPTTAQIVMTDDALVCKNSPVRLFINPTIFNDLDFSVSKIGERDGLFYFRSTRQISFEDAVAYARLMKGNLATLNTEEKNRFVSNLLPNEIKWTGYFQNPNSEFFNDPPDPSSGFEWMSGADNGYTAWAPEEPNNYEDSEPGMHVIQGCTNGNLSAWCDINKDDGHKYIAIIETPFDEIPDIPSITVLWETGETSREITVNPSKSKYYKASVFIDGFEIQDSVLVSIEEVEVNLTLPGGCGDPFKWKPEIITKVPLPDLQIGWQFGSSQIFDTFQPLLESNADGATLAGVRVNSLNCGTTLIDTSTIFDLAYPFVATSPIDYEAKLNEIVQLDIKNEKDNFVYKWEPASGLSDPTTAQPIFTALQPITYTVSINDGYDCITEEVFNFTIDPRIKIYLPDTFTPNGDGDNDKLEIFTSTGFYGQFRLFTIMDRWGKMLYQTESDWEWNGIYKSQTVPPGNYLYILDYEIENVPYRKSGYVRVLK